jgi:hypothetical protein
MTLKNTLSPLFSFLFFCSLSGSIDAMASSRNLCDDLVDSGTSSEADIIRCLHDPRFGRSDHYKEMEAAKLNKSSEQKTDNEKANQSKDNIEIKTFTQDDLFSAGFGKPFYAIRGDWSNNQYKEKRITEGDNLCQFLGYEKALTSKVSAELWENKNNTVKVDKQGLVIDTNFWGKLKDPEIYRDEDNEFTVRKYVEVSCVKRKDKDLEGSKDALKAIVERLDRINTPDDASNSLSGATLDPESNMNQDSRSSNKKEAGVSPFGYKRPDWIKEPAKNESK